MAGARLGLALYHIHQLFHDGSATGLSDTQLLQCFTTRRDEAAFAALLARHGPMVMSVCRSILHDPSDAEDAFQATFLVLARKAGSAWSDGQLGGWLHQVAYRIAIRASKGITRRVLHEGRAAKEANEIYPHAEFDDDLRPVLHEEITRLPEKLRLPIVLCYLQGLTHAQAAAQLSCGEATLRRRLAGARERLRVRLSQRGFASTASVLAVSLAGEASAAVRAACVQKVLRNVIRVAAGEALIVVAGARIATLTRGGLNIMTIGWKTAVLTAIALTTVAGLVNGFGVTDDKQPDPKTKTADLTVTKPVAPPLPASIAAEAKPDGIIPGKTAESEKWPLTLAQATQIALDNTDGVRVIAFGSPDIPLGDGAARRHSKVLGANPKHRPTATKIAQRDPNQSVWQFKSHVMGRLRAVEVEYWKLAEAYGYLSAHERAAAVAREIHAREKAEMKVGRGTMADIAEAAQRMEQFKLDVAVRASDVETSEQSLRNVLGLPGKDNRRIIPVSAPLEDKIEPDWEACLGEMLEHDPDIALQRLAIASRANGVKSGRDDREQEALKRELQQTIHERTHLLARRFLEIDNSYKQLQAASRVKAAAAQRLDAQRAYYEEGRITVDRFLDGISQCAATAAAEARYKTTYNVSLCAFEEAKGTLLLSDYVLVIDVPAKPVVEEVRMPKALASSLEKAPTTSPSLPPTPRVVCRDSDVNASHSERVRSRWCRRFQPIPGGLRP